MKKSNYNFVLNKGNKSFWFNGITHHHFCLDIPLSSKLKSSLESQESLEFLKSQTPSFYQKLVDKGFLVEDHVDELDIIRDCNKKVREAKNYFLVILPTMNCNFDCWYCVQNHVETVMTDVTIQKIQKHIQHVVEVDKINFLHIGWFGGEPFLFFKEVVLPISKFALSICEKAGIPFMNSATTNGYYVTPEIHSKLVELNFNEFQITIDGTRDLHNKVKKSKDGNSAFDVTLNNINSLLTNSKDIRITLRINYTNDNLKDEILSEVNEIIQAENRSKVYIRFRKVWQEKVDKARSSKVFEFINKFEKEGYCSNIKLDLDKGFIPCYADKKYYNTINYDGSVLKCTANDELQGSNPPGKLQDDGSILWKEGFLESYYKVRFENKICLNCMNLPVCMGKCGRDYKTEQDGRFVCKLKENDSNIEDVILQHLEKEYST